MFEWLPVSLELLVKIGEFFENRKIVYQKHDKYLNYRLKYLFDLYSHEEAIAKYVPYVELVNFLDITEGETSPVALQVSPVDFTMGAGSDSWEDIKHKAFNSLKESKRISDANEPAIRLTGMTVKGNKVSLKIEKARYNDQAKSNLVLDFSHTIHGLRKTLRSILHDQYNGKLPPLNEPRLANTVGIACLILYKDQGKWVPYLLRRTDTVAVFPGTIQCTASGVAKWPAGNPHSFDDFFTRHMYFELDEEVGLKPADIENFKLVGLCREFARGGKPQLVYMGTTHLTRAELSQKRKTARRVLRSNDIMQEIQGDNWLKTGDVVYTEDKIQQKIYRKKVSHESMLSFHYTAQYIKKFSLY